MFPDLEYTFRHALTHDVAYQSLLQDRRRLLHGRIVEVIADPPEADTATRRQGEAIALAEELGTRPLLAHCHLSLGKLYRRTDDGVKARDHLTTAVTMYREMNMSWLEKAEAALGPPHRNSP